MAHSLIDTDDFKNLFYLFGLAPNKNYPIFKIKLLNIRFMFAIISVLHQIELMKLQMLAEERLDVEYKLRTCYQIFYSFWCICIRYLHCQLFHSFWLSFVFLQGKDSLKEYLAMLKPIDIDLFIQLTNQVFSM